MSDLGVTEEMIPAMAETAFRLKRILRVNPRAATETDLERILQTAL